VREVGSEGELVGHVMHMNEQTDFYEPISDVVDVQYMIASYYTFMKASCYTYECVVSHT